MIRTCGVESSHVASIPWQEGNHGARHGGVWCPTPMPAWRAVHSCSTPEGAARTGMHVGCNLQDYVPLTVVGGSLQKGGDSVEILYKYATCQSWPVHFGLCRRFFQVPPVGFVNPSRPMGNCFDKEPAPPLKTKPVVAPVPHSSPAKLEQHQQAPPSDAEWGDNMGSDASKPAGDDAEGEWHAKKMRPSLHPG